MSNINKLLKVKTYELTELSNFAVMALPEPAGLGYTELAGYAQSINFYNWGDTDARIYPIGNYPTEPGMLLKAGESITLQAGDDLAIELSPIKVVFDSLGTGNINVSVEFHEVIESLQSFIAPNGY